MLLKQTEVLSAKCNLIIQSKSTHLKMNPACIIITIFIILLFFMYVVTSNIQLSNNVCECQSSCYQENSGSRGLTITEWTQAGGLQALGWALMSQWNHWQLVCELLCIWKRKRERKQVHTQPCILVVWPTKATHCNNQSTFPLYLYFPRWNSPLTFIIICLKLKKKKTKFQRTANWLSDTTVLVVALHRLNIWWRNDRFC